MNIPRPSHVLAWVLLSAVSSGATTYYVSSSAGSDANAGTEAAPWRTLAKINASTFAPGDVILLKRGDVWQESLVPPSSGGSGSPIVFDAYGSGAPPTISGYQDLPAWTLVSGNVWSAPATASGMNYVLFGTIWGQKQSSQSALQRERDFFFSANTLFVYSPGNPVAHYGSVAAIVLTGGKLIEVNGRSWLQFQHILLNWFDGYGVSVTGASDHLVFANLEADGMVPAGTLPHGFYVNAAPAPTDVQFINDEVRSSDYGWGQDNDRNLIGRFSIQVFSVPRLGRTQTYYLRQYDGAAPARYSRYSTALHIDYPL
jgi:hypothetical protein